MARVMSAANRSGEVFSSVIDATAITDNGCRASLTLNATSLADIALVITYTIEGLFNSVWQLLCSGEWRGGNIQPTNHLDPLGSTLIAQPVFSFGTTNTKPSQLRLRVSSNKTCRYSADIALI